MRTIKREQMGEVYVRVRLSNAIDLAMVEKGLLEKDKVRTCEVDALVDTGCTKSMLPVDLATQLGVSTSRQITGRLADGNLVTVGATDPILFEILGREAREDAYVSGNEVLIEQTVLESTDLLVDCKSQKVIPKHPEGPIFRL